MTDRPLIGLTLDIEIPDQPPPRGGPVQPFYALRENYCRAVTAAGGLPILLPHEPDGIARYLDCLDGLVVTGGDFDVDPALFGAAGSHASVTTKDRRTAFELELATRGAIEPATCPLLGICGGQQLLNVALGGSLIQHIPDELPDALEHEQPNPRNEPGHPVRLAPGSLLRRVCGAVELRVNSAHHQAVKAPGPGVSVNATAPDGVIEGIEAAGQRFCLGVQWHPEFEIDRGDRLIFAALVAAAEGRAP